MKNILAMPLVFIRFLFQSVLLALGQIWSNKMRSILTVIGIVIGVAAVITVIAVLSGLKAKVLSDLETFGTNNIYIQPEWPNTGPKKNASWTIIMFRSKQFEGLLENCPSVKRIGLAGWLGTQNVRYADKSVDGVRLRCVEPEYQQIEKSQPLQGRMFTVIDDMGALPVCRIGIELRNKLNLPKECVGEIITVGTRQYRIIGVIEKRPEMSVLGGGGQDRFDVYIPFRTGLKINATPWVYALAESKTTELSEEAQAEMKFFLRKTRGLKPGEPDTFQVESVKSYIDKFSQISGMITLVAASVVSISLIVGGVGIMNIMLVSVSERTREIGLRKAVGARRSAILMQFLIEAIVLCLLGGLLGILLGELIIRGIMQTTPYFNKTYIPFWSIALSFGFAAVVGLCFGFFPAVKAARLDPIEALRHE